MERPRDRHRRQQLSWEGFDECRAAWWPRELQRQSVVWGGDDTHLQFRGVSGGRGNHLVFFGCGVVIIFVVLLLVLVLVVILKRYSGQRVAWQPFPVCLRSQGTCAFCRIDAVGVGRWPN